MLDINPDLKKLYDKHILKDTFTKDDMLAVLAKVRARKFKKGATLIAYDRMQKNYKYKLTEDTGKKFNKEFKPELTPLQMLKMGVFEGKYCNDCILEYPKEWFIKRTKTAEILDTLSPEGPNYKINYYKIKARLSLGQWKRNKWIPCTYTRAGIAFCKERDIKPDSIYDPDIRGWFQWYCRYYLGRRLPVIDDIQIRRWRNFKRHVGQLQKNCKGNQSCRPRQHQAVLQWAYDATKL